MQINWELKSLLFGILNRVPGNLLYLTQKYVTGRSRVIAKEIKKEWLFHEQIINSRNARNVIEFGAGKSLIQNLYLTSTGINQVVVDLNKMVDFDQVNDAISELLKLGAAIDGRSVHSFQELKDVYKIDYLAPVDMRNTHFEDDTFDLCISTNTMEHIPEADLAKICHELIRVLKPTGAISSKIDYSDHYAHTDKSITVHNFLQYSAKEWARHNHSNHFQNRLRHGHYKRLFSDAGLTLSKVSAEDIKPFTNEKLREENLCNDGDDEAISGYFVLSMPAKAAS
ncbi:MAG: methyltransferase domain-containing protein [Pseudomonadota bacterium]